MTPDPASRVQLLRVERTQSSIDALAGAVHRLLCERESPVLMPLGPMRTRWRCATTSRDAWCVCRTMCGW